MIRPLLLTPSLALLVCACGHASTSQQHISAQPVQPARPAVAAQQQAAAPAVETAATAQSETEQATAAQETVGGNSDDDRAPPDRSDVSLERLAALPADAVLPSGKWKPGVNYDALTPAQPTNVGPGKVEVVEVFWLGCPHCYALEPFVEAWLKNKPNYIDFVRVPVMWGPAHRAHARLFYTLVALNRSDLFEKAFDTIQQQHQPLIAQSDDETLKLQEGFAKENGISAEDYAKAYNSFSVNSNLQRAEQLTQRYQVQGVPLVVVDGKYTTDVSKAGGPQQLIQIIDDLAASEHHH
jgi:protein dithiol oxidoreductase (disulfide-forming)